MSWSVSKCIGLSTRTPPTKPQIFFMWGNLVHWNMKSSVEDKEMMWNETIWLIFYRFDVLCSWASESKSEDTFSRPTFYALQHSFSDGYSEVPNRHDIGMFFCTQKGEQTTRSSNIPARWRFVDTADQTKYIILEESTAVLAARWFRVPWSWIETWNKWSYDKVIVLMFICL